MYVCMHGGLYEILRGMTCTVCTVWQVAGSSALSYCKGRVPYLVSGMKIYSSVQEEGDCASMALGGSEVKSAPSRLQQGHTDRQTQVSNTDRQPMPRDPHTPRAPYDRRTCTYVCMYVCMYDEVLELW